MDDYEEVLEGCVAQLPGILAKADYAREKQDLTLIFKYLTDCCMMSGPPARRSPVDSVLVRLVSTQARAFVRMLIEFNRLYATDAEEQYRALFLDPVCGTLENIVFEEDLGGVRRQRNCRSVLRHVRCALPRVLLRHAAADRFHRRASEVLPFLPYLSSLRLTHSGRSARGCGKQNRHDHQFCDGSHLP